MTTIDRLEQLHALAEVGGRWSAERLHTIDCADGDPVVRDSGAREEDLYLIAAAVNALPALLRVAKAARAYLRATIQAEAGEVEELVARRAALDVERALGALDEVSP